jgi:hypothetical protein
MTKPKVDVTQSVGESLRARKAYASPQLVRYGNVAEITRNVGQTGQMDGGGAMMNRSQV